MWTRTQDSDSLPFFVYGTLRLDEARQDVWEKEVVRILPSCSVSGYRLCAPRHALWPVAKPSPEDNIWGDVLFFDDVEYPAMLERLDTIEGSPYMYERTIVEVHRHVISEQSPFKAWMYQEGPLFRDGKIETPIDIGSSWTARSFAVARWEQKEEEQKCSTT